MKLLYDSWLKSCISNYLEFEDTNGTKAKPEYQNMLMVLRNILHCMGGEGGKIVLSNEQVYCMFMVLQGHVHTRVEPKQAARYLKFINETSRGMISNIRASASFRILQCARPTFSQHFVSR